MIDYWMIQYTADPKCLMTGSEATQYPGAKRPNTRERSDPIPGSEATQYPGAKRPNTRERSDLTTPDSYPKQSKNPARTSITEGGLQATDST